MNDVFNTIESELITLLSGDATITAEVPADHFHEKLKADLKNYYDHMLPAIAAHSIGYTRGDDGVTHIIHSVIEVVHKGGDLATVDGKVKKIMSLIMDKLNDENRAYGGLLDQNVEDVYVTGGDVIPAQSENVFLVSGLLNVDCEIVEP